ncbi:hypothetical protein NDU88_006300 [Pleurodeles waltl]|uniref:Uncharacterized protein n=1 Tax=Pleurodeles waltl TaxID=8319 RepID=A0AAV7MYT6_PLEWA|nr:hypothetical protein NDU88_006300 [Pleurodeles waltl]
MAPMKKRGQPKAKIKDKYYIGVAGPPMTKRQSTLRPLKDPWPVLGPSDPAQELDTVGEETSSSNSDMSKTGLQASLQDENGVLRADYRPVA